MLKHTSLVVSFGGISMKSRQINQGGIGDHSARGHLQRWRDPEVVCISPVRDDLAEFLEADRWPIHPNADVALMLISRTRCIAKIPTTKTSFRSPLRRG